MKKIMGLLLMMGLMVSFVGCSKDTPTGPSEEVAKGPQGQTLEVATEEDSNGNVDERFQFYWDGVPGEDEPISFEAYGALPVEDQGGIKYWDSAGNRVGEAEYISLAESDRGATVYYKRASKIKHGYYKQSVKRFGMTYKET